MRTRHSYRTRPASPAPSFSHWAWSDEGLRVNDRWWLAMTYAAVARLSHDYTRFRPTTLRKGRQRASALGVTATLSVSKQARDPAAAAGLLLAGFLPPPRSRVRFRRPPDLTATHVSWLESKIGPHVAP